MTIIPILLFFFSISLHFIPFVSIFLSFSKCIYLFFFFFGDLVTLHKSKEEGISKGLKAQKMTIWRGPNAIRVAFEDFT